MRVRATIADQGTVTRVMLELYLCGVQYQDWTMTPSCIYRHDYLISSRNPAVLLDILHTHKVKYVQIS